MTQREVGEVGLEARFAEFKRLLGDLWGSPHYENDRIALFQGDCVDLLGRLASPAFDLVVTSPPYNIGKEYEAPMPLDEYVEWCGSWMKLLHQVTKDDGAFWLNLGYVPIRDVGKAVPLPYLLWNRAPYFLIQEVVWNYGAGVAAKTSFSPRNEKFLWFVKDPNDYVFDLDAVRDPDVKYPNQKKNGKLKCNPLGKNPTDVWNLPKVTSGRDRSSKERTDHPAQFPVAVIERIVRACSTTGGLLFDPFVGSGTIAEVAIKTGRFAVGIDINSKYLDIARARCERALEQGEQAQLAGIEG